MFKLYQKIVVILIIAVLTEFVAVKNTFADNPPENSPTETISVSANVPAPIDSLPISLQSLTTGNNFQQNTILNYKITYGSLNTGTIPLTIQAQWSQGTIEGSPVPSVDVVQYVIGSASDAYGSTPAIVDTVNNTITWTISVFPGNTTNRTVTFSLETNESYTGFSSVSFDVSTRAFSSSTVTPDQKITTTYLYKPTPTPNPTNTPTPGPSTTTTTVNTPTPTPTTAKTPAFSGIVVQSLSESNAQIAIGTNSNSTFVVKYGTSANLLSQNLTSLTPLKANAVILPDLEPDTNYYFKVVATDAGGKVTNSDIFTFQTATVSEAPVIDTGSLLATSNNSVLVNAAAAPTTAGGKQAPKGQITLPESSTFDIQFSLKKYTVVKSIQAIVRSKVLGISTFFVQPAEANTNFADLIEVSPGVYSGRLKSVATPGAYEVFIRIVDYKGNIIEQKLADLIVTQKFSVYDESTKSGIENARVLLYLYDETSRIYKVISPQIIPIQNPAFSDSNGDFNVVLPYGKYRADISAIGYKSKIIEFAVSTNGGYPAVSLIPSKSILTIASYYGSTLFDTLVASQIFLQEQAQSSRLFNLSTIGAVIFLIGITALSISARTHISVIYFPYFIYFKLTILFRKNKARIVFGKVIDEKTDSPISRAKVYLATPDGKHVLVSLQTNKLGEFYYNNPKGLDYKITVVKEGYSLQEPWNFVNTKITQIPALLKMEEKDKLHYSLLTIVVFYAEDLLGLLMESLILFGLLVQIYFIFTFGFIKVAPFIIITILNIVLILTYLYKPRYLQP